jgi:hypothetical protein
VVQGSKLSVCYKKVGMGTKVLGLSPKASRNPAGNAGSLLITAPSAKRQRVSVGNIHVSSVTSVKLRKNDNKHYYNDESPYKCGMKQEHKTLATRIMYLPRVLPNARYSATKWNYGC